MHVYSEMSPVELKRTYSHVTMYSAATVVRIFSSLSVFINYVPVLFLLKMLAIDRCEKQKPVELKAM